MCNLRRLRPPPVPAPTPAPVPPAAPAPLSVYFLADRSTVTDSGWDRESKRISGVTYAHSFSNGYGHSAVSFDIERKCTAFDAVLGLADTSSPRAKDQLEVYGDGRQLYSGLIDFGQGFPVHLDLSGVLRLELRTIPTVEDEDGYGYEAAEDVFGDARITCSTLDPNGTVSPYS